MKQGYVRNIAFDLGGVVLALSYENAVRRFEEIGLKNARQHLDAYRQHGIFGALEEGAMTAEAFCKELSLLVGHPLTMDDCYYAWHGYVEAVPKRNLQAILKLRHMGLKVCLLSNTNPFMMQWARTPAFDGGRHSIDDYFNALYLSYECKVMKPSATIFRLMLEGQQSTADETLFIDDSPNNVEAAAELGMQVLCPQNNEDWTSMLFDYLTI